MKCNSCGYENSEYSAFCTACGSPMEQQQNPAQQYAPPAAVNPAAERVFQMLKDNLFMLVCVFITAGSALSLSNKGFPIFEILITIFLWILFAKSRKGMVDQRQIRGISGTVFASYVVTWVVCGILAVCGLILIGLSSVVSATGMWDEILSQFDSYGAGYAGIIHTFASLSFVLIGVVVIVAAAVVVLFNIFGTRSIHRFVQSMYKSVEQGQMNLVKRGTAQAWIMVLGIFSAISSVSSLTSQNFTAFLAGGCTASASIIGSILIGKYFADCR